MKKNDVFNYTTSNGDVVKAVVVAIIGGHEDTWSTYTHYLCYAQRKLFKYVERYTMEETGIEASFAGTSDLVDYAVLPEYDAMLERYYDLEVAQAKTQSGM